MNFRSVAEKSRKMLVIAENSFYYPVLLKIFCQARKFSGNPVPGFQYFFQLRIPDVEILAIRDINSLRDMAFKKANISQHTNDSFFV